MSNKCQFYIATVSALLLSVSAHAQTTDHRDVVRDRHDQVVRSTLFGTCVRTQWNVGADACAPAQEEARKPIPRTILTSAERTVYFEFNKSTLTPEAQRNLSSVAQKLREAKDVHSAQIVGYADRIGSSAYNLQLSKQRAERVKDYLAQQGYLNTRVAEVRGLGESQPVTSCDPNLPREQAIQCLSRDRRVEVEVQYLDAN